MTSTKRLVYLGSAAVLVLGLTLLFAKSMRQQPPSSPPPPAPGVPASGEAPAQAETAPSGAVAEVPQASSEAPASGDTGLSFLKPEEVRARIGEPDAQQEESDRIEWFYHRPAETYQDKPLCVAVHFMEGEVKATVNYPCEQMPDMIATARLVPRPRVVPPRETRYKMEAFYALVQGKTKSEIRQALGEPEILHVIQGKEVWQYQEIVDDGDGKRWSFAIQFEGETASEINGG